jgi:hypothetical protein
MVHRLHRRPDPGKGFVPFDRHEMAGRGIVAQGMGEAPGVFRSWSDQPPQLFDAVAGKEIGSTRLAVASQVTALALLSQNSNEEVCAGSGHAHPGQSNPSGWFICNSARALALGPICLRTASATARKAPQPPAGPS